MSLSIVELDKTHQEVQYLTVGAIDGHPRLRVNGDEVNVFLLPRETEVFNFGDDLLTVSNLLRFNFEVKFENVLNKYKIVDNTTYNQIITPISSISFDHNGERLVMDIMRNVIEQGQIEITNCGPNGTPDGSGSCKDCYAPKDESGNRGHSPLYTSVLNEINRLISEISVGTGGKSGWIDELNKCVDPAEGNNPLEAKRNLLEEGVDDKTELIQEHTAPDFLAFKTLVINLGTTTRLTPVGDPVYLYLDEEIDSDSYQFRYIDKAGEKTPIQFQHTIAEIVSDSANAAIPGSYIQLQLNYVTDSGTVDYGPTEESAVPCTYDGSDILWFGRGGSGSELTLIQIEKALYNTRSFWIDVDENRLIIYPKTDFEEYKITSAILTNVM